MGSYVRAITRCSLAALLATASVVSCGDDDSSDDGGGGSSATGGTAGDGGEATGGTSGSGGTTAGGEGGVGGEGASGGSGADCARDSDCVPIGECYDASCREGSCVGSPLARGSACTDGFCNGFARCLPCLDDAAGAREDSGCSEDSPMCDELASEPECVGCLETSDCDDGVECTTDSCADSECQNEPEPLGSPCSDGLCNGEADENSCGLCVDDRSAGMDKGCSLELPHCDARRVPATCTGCESSLDCFDDNECTSDRCFGGVCERATLLSGTPCSLGYCNGIRGAEVCVPKPCQTDPDCNDGVDCTAEVCVAGVCVYTPNDDQCPESDDVCEPNVCTVGTGCLAINVARSRELLSNGRLDLGNVDWTELSTSYDQVIYPYTYIPTLFPHTPEYVAYLGGGHSLDESSSISQTVAIPDTAVRLELSFFYQIWIEDQFPDDHNHMEVRLRSTDASPIEEVIVTRYNQDATRVWTGFHTTIDVANWAGSDAILEFSGTGIDGFTAFLVDSISLVATVCE